MKRTLNWQDLNLFLAVARRQGLAGAVADTSSSAATLSRRMTNLEHSLEQRLFERGARGYTLTAAGKNLLERAEKMELACQEIQIGRDDSPIKRRIKISAGSWTMQLLINNIDKYWCEDDIWIPEFVATDARLDIARKQIDIGIRNSKPTEPWLAAQLIGHTNYAAYRLRETPDNLGWVVAIGENALTPTARYVMQNYSDKISFNVSHALLGLPLVLKGHAQMILPKFVGDSFKQLVREQSFVESLKTDLWLVMHQDERNHPPVRKAIDAIGEFLRNDYRNFNG